MMVSNKSGRKFRIGYIIFSIAVSISLWLYVTKDLNPTRDWTVNRVPVVFVGEDLLENSNLIVSAREATEISVTFNGRYNDVSKLNNTNVRAVVDLTEILTQYTAPTGTHALEAKIETDVSGNNVSVLNSSKHTIEVTVERLVTQSFPLTPIYNGGVADGYMAGDLTLSRNSVDISGTESAISRIARATVTLNGFEDLSKTTSREEAIRLLDENGEEIDMEEEGLKFTGDSTAVITQSILLVKDVALVIDIIESPTATDANITINIEPRTIKLSGDPEVLEGINEINLGTQDLGKIILSSETTYQIRIPNNTTNLSNISTAKVKIEVLNMETGRLSATNITYRNARDGAVVEIISQSVDITLRGNQASLDQVKAENIRVVADFTEYADRTGYFTVPAKVYVDGFQDVEAVGDYVVTVNVS